MKKNRECRIGIGDVCLGISSDDAGFMGHFQHYYGRCLVESAPDFSIHIEIRNNLRWGEIPRTLSEYRKDEPVLGQGHFSLYDNLISGSMDPEARRCELRVEIALIASEYLPLFQDFVFRDLFYSVSRTSTGNGRYRSFIVHGCGIVHRGKGFLFLGPSGSGKTTIANLSKDDVVLHDEAVLLSERDGGYLMEMSPYPSGIRNLGNTRWALEAAFLLVHGRANEIRGLPKPEAAGRLMPLIALPMPLDSVPRSRVMDEILSFACRTVEAVPFFELHFLPQDDGFWKAIEERGNSEGGMGKAEVGM